MLKLYTDGACKGNPGPGGWAAVLVVGENETVITGNKKYTTNNHMELLAVIQGLFLLNKPEEILVTTDSKYVEESFNKKWYETWIEENQIERPNFELWRMLYNLKDIHKIRIEWVKGHDGHHYNELCDKLASKEAEKIADITYILTSAKNNKENEVSQEVEKTVKKKKVTKSNKKEVKKKKDYDFFVEEGNKGKFYYAVAKGRKVGIYNSWESCKEQIDAFSGAVFKKFKTIEEAGEFVENNK